MRFHAKNQSAPTRLRPRLALLIATAAAFLLVPAAQALAQNPTLTVNVFGFEEGGGEVINNAEVIPPGVPPIECFLPEGKEEGFPPEGTCENEMLGEPPEFGEVLQAVPGPHSEFAFWEITSGFSFPGFCPEELNEQKCWIFSGGENAEVTAYFFCKEGEVCEEVEPLPPRPVTAKKTGSGNGWIHSGAEDEPGTINCGLPCTEKTDVFEGPVTLTAYGAQFVEWTSCPGAISGRECEVPSSEEAQEAVAEFSVNHSIKVTKTGTGNGWVHSEPAGINCGLACEMKIGFFEVEVVTLTAYGAEFDEWTECPGAVSGRECTITSIENKEAEVQFTE